MQAARPTPRQIGIPIKVLYESVGFTCTVETKNGTLYRGLIIDVEDCFNIQMRTVSVTNMKGQKSELENVYIRGSQVRYVVLPDMLKNSPTFHTNREQAPDEDYTSEHTQKRSRN